MYQSIKRSDNYLPPLLTELNTQFLVVKEETKTPVWDTPTADSNGQSVFKEWKPEPVFEHEFNRFLKDVPLMCSRIRQLDMAVLSVKANNLKDKLALKKAADVEMGDATAESRAIAASVAKQVDAYLKQYGPPPQVSSSPVFDSWFTNADFHFLAVSEAEGTPQEVQQERQEEVGEGQQGQVQERQKEELTTQQEGWVLQADKGQARQERRRFVVQNRKAARQIERRLYDSQGSPLIVYVDHATYPNEILLTSRPFAIRYLLSCAPPTMLELARFRSGVFCGPDVYLPSHLAIHVSAGLKFMLYEKPQPDLLRHAYSDFERRLRWKFNFMEDYVPDFEDDPYDPDYDLHEVSTKLPPSAPIPIENGLQAGKSWVEQTIQTIEPLVKATSKDSGLVWLDELKDYLDSHNYVISMTDKNLGSAVVTRDWLLKGSTSMLSAPRDYRKLNPGEEHVILQDIVNKIKTICDMNVRGLSLYLADPQLHKWLQSRLPSEDGVVTYPQFYVIPKIHKNPTGFRPIVPCHSNITEPLAKVVSKALKPLVFASPYIIHGSKNLAQRLSQLKLNRDRKVWIVTGDIVAYYPNIPKYKAVTKVTVMFIKWCRDNPEYMPEDMRALVIECLKTSVLSPLVVQFLGDLYDQVRGVPMGQACSPDIANLYAAYYEAKYFERLYPPPESAIAFYGRYIDDCLGIVYAETREQAIAYMVDAIQIPGVQFTWEASERSVAFLDMWLFVDTRNAVIGHKPYSKPLNHFERIPWASHHPKDVKKGTFLGEMSRFATLCSNEIHYKDALYDLRKIYVARGYPKNLVDAWLKDHTVTRWQRRLDNRTISTDNVLVLKSEFNPMWTKFNVHELFNILRAEWVQRDPYTVWCDLKDGVCSIHNEQTIPMSAEVSRKMQRHREHRQDALDAYEAAQVAFRAGVQDSILQPRPAARKRKAPIGHALDFGENLVQRSLEDFTGAGGSFKRLKISSGQTSPQPIISESFVAGPAPAAVTIALEKLRVDKVTYVAKSSCADPLTPRLNPPVGPYSWAKRWEYSGAGVYLHCLPMYDIRKTTLLDSRMLVSRKRTTNVFDLASLWRKQQISSVKAGPLQGPVFVDEWSHNL